MITTLALYAALELGQGPLSGFTQTPKGGTPGTTSYERPSYQELHQHEDHFGEAILGAQYHRWILEADYWHTHPKAQNTLNTGLITHAKTIPAQTDFQMGVRFDEYNLQLGYLFTDLCDTWSIIPRIEGEWLHYAYHFDTPDVQSERAFTLITAGVGFTVVKHFSDRFSGTLQAQCNLPITNFHYLKADLGLYYRLAQYRCVTLSPYVKLGMFRFDYEDQQRVPNHIRYQNFPWISLGLVFAGIMT